MLILTAHGSTDPRSAASARALAGRLAAMRPALDVRVAFLEKNAPSLVDVLQESTDRTAPVVSPLLLADAHHARIDVPAHIEAAGVPGVRQAGVLGEDTRLVSVLRQRIGELGCSTRDTELGVVIAAVGTSSSVANVKTSRVAAALMAGTEWAATTTSFVTGPLTSLDDAVGQLRRRGARRLVIAPWFLAPGRLIDRINAWAQNADIPVAAPLGAHPGVAATVLSRYGLALARKAAA